MERHYFEILSPSRRARGGGEVKSFSGEDRGMFVGLVVLFEVESLARAAIDIIPRSESKCVHLVSECMDGETFAVTYVGNTKIVQEVEHRGNGEAVREPGWYLIEFRVPFLCPFPRGSIADELI